MSQTWIKRNTYLAAAVALAGGFLLGLPPILAIVCALVAALVWPYFLQRVVYRVRVRSVRAKGRGRRVR